MKYYLIAGEASGDLHGSYLLQSIFQQDENAQVRFWGGDKMAEIAQQPPVKHIKDLAFMGFVEVITHLNTILGNISFCKKDIQAFNPDIVVFVDYPGFNLRIAKWCHKQGFKTAYYISPQIWAWKENRVKAIKKYIDKMIVILPFEKDFYKKHGMDVEYVGHPLVDIIREAQQAPLDFLPTHQKRIALLPGSRKQEISKMLPKMLSVIHHFPDYTFYIASAPNIPHTFYTQFVQEHHQVTFSTVSTYQLLRQSEAALVTSGTATLEVALLKVPEIVCYIGHPISIWLAKRLIKIKFISLVNLILDKLVVKELIQEDLNEQNLVHELKELLDKNSSRYIQIQQDYNQLHQALSVDGAAQRAAQIICKFAQ